MLVWPPAVPHTSPAPASPLSLPSRQAEGPTQAFWQGLDYGQSRDSPSVGVRGHSLGSLMWIWNEAGGSLLSSLGTGLQLVPSPLSPCVRPGMSWVQ